MSASNPSTRAAARVLTAAVGLTCVGIVTAADGHTAIAVAAAFAAGMAALIVIRVILYRETSSDD